MADERDILIQDLRREIKMLRTENTKLKAKVCDLIKRLSLETGDLRGESKQGR